MCGTEEEGGSKGNGSGEAIRRQKIDKTHAGLRGAKQSFRFLMYYLILVTSTARGMF